MRTNPLGIPEIDNGVKNIFRRKLPPGKTVQEIFPTEVVGPMPQAVQFALLHIRQEALGTEGDERLAITESAGSIRISGDRDAWQWTRRMALTHLIS